MGTLLVSKKTVQLMCLKSEQQPRIGRVVKRLHRSVKRQCGAAHEIREFFAININVSSIVYYYIYNKNGIYVK